MSGEDRRSHRRPGATRGASPAKRVFGPMTAASAAAYVRSRDLPRLLPLCRRARANHWSYDLNRHLGLLSAYKGELASLALEEPEAQLNCTRRDSGKS
jgi:hypothetical protein